MTFIPFSPCGPGFPFMPDLPCGGPHSINLMVHITQHFSNGSKYLQPVQQSQGVLAVQVSLSLPVEYQLITYRGISHGCHMTVTLQCYIESHTFHVPYTHLLASWSHLSLISRPTLDPFLPWSSLQTHQTFGSSITLHIQEQPLYICLRVPTEHTVVSYE